MSRRDQILMAGEEVAAFLDEEKTAICATIGRDGWPHLMPLWYVVREGTVWAWTFAKSQKVRNLERDARATLQVEAGTAYPELRGVMVKCQVRVHADPDTVLGVGLQILTRYGDGGAADAVPDATRDAIRAQAQKRVALEFVEQERTSWDHRKLGAGVY